MSPPLNAAALVVGIDNYAYINKLQGCVTDAADMCAWLIDIGVDPARIRCHLSPRPELASAALDGRVSPKPASRADIWQSVIDIDAEFRAAPGDWLFVHWSGHGYFLIEERRPVFLTPEWREQDTAQNLDVFAFSEYFQSLRCKAQFFVFDACQNYPQSAIEASKIQPMGPNVKGSAPDPAQSVALCCAVAQGQVAPIVNGRGVLTSELLKALREAETGALPSALADAIDFNWDTGARRVDMERLFENVVAPRVQHIAKTHNRVQNPTFEQRGAGKQGRPFYIRPLPDIDTAELTISAELAANEDLITVNLNPPVREPLKLPLEPRELPFKGRAPLNARLIADCLAKPGWTPIPPNYFKPKLAGRTLRIHFDLNAAIAPDDDLTNIATIGPDGAPGQPLSDRDLSDLGLDPHRLPTGVSRRADKRGLDFADKIDFGAIAERLRTKVRSRGEDLLIAPPGVRLDSLRPNVRIELPPQRDFAGYLDSVRIINIKPYGASDDTAPVRLSVSEVRRQPSLRLHPGLYRWEIDLPWGRTFGAVEIGDEAIALCRLEAPEGLEPLRHGLLHSSLTRANGDRVFVAGGKVAAPAHQDLIAREFEDANLYVPGFPNIPILLQNNGDEWRAEPYARVPIPEWDLIFTAARLHDVNLGRALTSVRAALLQSAQSVHEHDLLLLAFAYAARAQGEQAMIEKFLYWLRTDEARGSGDAAILRASARKLPTPDFIPAPLLRWGGDLSQTRTADQTDIAEIVSSSAWAVYRRLEWAAPIDMDQIKMGHPGEQYERPATA